MADDRCRQDSEPLQEPPRGHRGYTISGPLCLVTLAFGALFALTCCDPLLSSVVSFFASPSRTRDDGHEWGRLAAQGILNGSSSFSPVKRRSLAAADDDCYDVKKGMPPAVAPLPSVVIRRALAYEGDMLRFDPLIKKVVEDREPITVLGIGSSCTSEFGGRKGPQMKLLNYDAFDYERVVHPHGWLSTALDWLVGAYPPKKNMTWKGSDFALHVANPQELETAEEPYWFINVAIGALGPGPWTQCIGATYLPKLPKKVDLIVIEWALAANNPEITKHLEMVIQRLLKMWDPPPAFLMVNFFFWCRGNLWCRKYMVDPRSGLERLFETEVQFPLHWNNIGVFSFDSFDPKNTGKVTEDDYRAMAQYYGFPMVSMRDAFWLLAAHQQKGYELYDLIGHHDMGLHPGIPLARTRYASVLVGIFQNLIAEYQQRKKARLAAKNKAVNDALLKRPATVYERMYPNESDEQQPKLGACYSYETWDGSLPPIRSKEGFEFTKDPDSKIPKPGFGTWKAGSYVEYLLDTLAVGKGLDFPSEEAAGKAECMLQIRYLESYERMGKASLKCVEGCTCEGGVMDGHTTQHWSIPQDKSFKLSQSPKCVVRIETERSGGGEKFKILSLSIRFKPVH